MSSIRSLPPLAPNRIAAPVPAAAPRAPRAPLAKPAPAAPASAPAPLDVRRAATFAGPSGPIDDLGPLDLPAADAGAEAATSRPGRQSKADLDAAVATARKADPKLRLAVDSTSNAATFLSGEFQMKLTPGADKPKDAIASKFLADHGKLFGVSDASTQLRLVDTTNDELGFDHYKYQQYQGDLPVFGQQVIVHAQGATVRSVGGRMTPNVELGDFAPSSTTLESALASVRSSLSNAEDVKVVGKETLGVYTTGDGSPRVAYELNVANGTDGAWRYYVDAQNGKVLDHWSTMQSVLNRETYDAQGRQSMGKLVRKEGDGPHADVHVNKVHDNGKAVYDFYKDSFGRDGIDGKGMTIKQTLHYGNKYNNAFWDGQKMTYGDGDGVRFTHFGDAADVVGHEMAHGVTERTANLRYYKQSGALNESWSDVFGNLIEKWSEEKANPGSAERDPKWFVGEEIYTPGTGDDGLRSMSEPGKGYPGDPQPGHMRDYKNTSSDNGGVHINSGIPNKAAYEVSRAIGNDKLGKIWYRAQTSYLTSNSQFLDAANVTAQAAADLFGKDSAEVKAVQTAWTNVGLTPTAVPSIG